jgi:4-amino-4-deoxy-L-arabinose transferase-like glycosyltransferase
VCGLLALTRAELVLLVVVLPVPLIVVGARDVSRRDRAVWTALSVVVAGAVIAPWTAYNTARFDEPVLLTHTLGYNLSISNCDHTYAGGRIGFFDERCLEQREAEGPDPGGDSSTLDSQRRRDGVEYVTDHLSRVPVVVLARVGRAFGVFRPGQQVTLEPRPGTSLAVNRLAFGAYWLLVPCAVLGAVVLRRRGALVFPLLAFVGVAAVAVAITYGYSRYRAPAEVSLVLLAAVGLDAMLTRWERRRAASAPVGASPAA